MRVSMAAVLLTTALFSGCGSAGGGLPIPGPGDRSGDVIAVGGDRDERADRNGETSRARRLGVPRGHYPPPGECRIWYPGEPPGQQPPPARCDRLAGRVPYGAFVLYNDREWDSRYDWEGHERRNRGAVPAVILDLMRSVRR